MGEITLQIVNTATLYTLDTGCISGI